VIRSYFQPDIFLVSFWLPRADPKIQDFFSHVGKGNFFVNRSHRPMCLFIIYYYEFLLCTTLTVIQIFVENSSLYVF
jgi:hypothetical protein